MSAADWQLFGEDVQVGFSQNGVLHVLDADNFRVLAVDESGALVWEAGSEGGGPGEFGLPMSLAVAPDGSTVVYDLGHQAMVRFGSDGTYIEQVPHGMDLGIPGQEMLADPTGGVVFSGAGAVAMRRDASGTTMTQGGSARTPIRRALAGYRDGVAYEAWRLPAMPVERAPTGSGMSMSMPGMRTFEPELFYAPLADDRMVVVDTVDYAVKVIGSDGAVERVLVVYRVRDEFDVTSLEVARTTGLR